MNEKVILLTAKQVSEHLRIPLRTVYYLSKQGKIRSIKIGGQRRFIESDIEEYGAKYVKGEISNFITAREVSRYLSIPLRTVYRYSKEGKIRSVKIGSQWRYLREDVEKCISDNTDFYNEAARKSPSPYPLPCRDSSLQGLPHFTNYKIDGAAKSPQKACPKGERVIEMMRGYFIERRAYPRLNCNFKCQYSIKLPPFKEIISEGIVKDMSAGGISLIVRDDGIDEIKINDPVDLYFNIVSKHRLENINTEGKIVRMDNNEVGIKFRDISNEDKDKIIQYVG